MDWITPNIALGDWTDAQSMPRDGVDRVLNVAREVPVEHALPCLHINLIDGYPIAPDVFKKAFVYLAKGDTKGKKTLVHCAVGHSRSAAIVAMYLAIKYKTSFDQALAFVKSKRPGVDPAHDLIKSARKFVADSVKQTSPIVENVAIRMPEIIDV